MYKRQSLHSLDRMEFRAAVAEASKAGNHSFSHFGPEANHCLLYTSDAADERSSVDLGGRRIIKKNKHK